MQFIKFAILLFALFFSSIGFCYDYFGDADSFGGSEIVPTAVAAIEFSRTDPEISKLVKITGVSFKKAAIIGLMNYHWTVTKITDLEIWGKLKEEYEARIELAKNSETVRIYVTGPRVKQKWADNIRHEMAAALVLLSN